jgi:hypothetical protein
MCICKYTTQLSHLCVIKEINKKKSVHLARLELSIVMRILCIKMFYKQY